jgi:hypothetical protein
VEGVVKRQIDDTTNAVKTSGDGETDRDADPSKVRRTCRVLMIDNAMGTVLVIFFGVGRFGIVR